MGLGLAQEQELFVVPYECKGVTRAQTIALPAARPPARPQCHARCDHAQAQAQAAGERFADMAARLGEALDALQRAAAFLGAAPSEAALAGATPFLRLFALARGGTGLAALALAAQREDPSDPAGRLTLAQFFAQNIASGAGALERSIVQGHESVLESDAALGIAS